MRALLHIDVVTAARVLLSVPEKERSDMCDNLFQRAHIADKYRKHFDVNHARYGAGCLASSCQGLIMSPEPFLSDRDYAHCMKTVFERVIRGAGG
jgi:hypothetical protein